MKEGLGSAEGLLQEGLKEVCIAGGSEVYVGALEQTGR